MIDSKTYDRILKFMENQMKNILLYGRLTLLSKGTGDIPVDC